MSKKRSQDKQGSRNGAAPAAAAKHAQRAAQPEGAYALLADYERRSLAHDPGVPEQIEAPGLWRAIG
ncbi:MAG TPA: hypothetical protein VFP92_02570, partial [Rhodanobacteraceae bacterium]|nr:hypothetical protein [Rhodanobacteraceae bacterium]